MQAVDEVNDAQKLILNSFSTAVMIRLGRTWSNLMVDVVATNAKLRGRVVRILQEATGADEAEARTALEQADGELKPALLAMLAHVDATAARAAIEKHHGSVAHALPALTLTAERSGWPADADDAHTGDGADAARAIDG